MPLIESSFGVLALWAVIGYLLGSLPGGMLFARLFNLGNLREIGSGNIGTTNVLRTGSKKAAALTLLFDAGKGAVVVLLARAFAAEDAAQLGALMAFFGHCFPVWLGFKGGKGVATFLGILWALAWPIGAAACLIWLAVAFATRYSSLSALVAAGLVPFVLVGTGQYEYVALAILLELLVFERHKANIARLRAGTESKIGAK